MTDRRSAAEVRSFTMESRLLAEFDRVGQRELDIQLGLATRQSLIRLAGDTAGGLVTGAVFAVLALLLVNGVVEIAVAGAAVVVIRVAQGALGTALSSLTLVYESGLYLPSTGRVCWDGTDLASVDGTSLRDRIAVIAQDHTHWPLTARRNVVMSSPGADPARLERAARASRADAVVAELDRGWETLLDKRFVDGAEPSGGQWQRLAAARGFYRGDDGERTPLLIADEPTAALDARAEHAFFASLHAHAGRTGAAVVLITHRLASVRMADHIVVLDRGRVVEQGDHAELLAADGLYRELWDLQASAYRFAEEGEPAA